MVTTPLQSPTTDHGPAEEIVLLVVGEAGDGKSTLVDALRDQMEDIAPPKIGKSARGVTKEIVGYRGKPIKGRPVKIFDTPGLGDLDIKVPDLVAQIERTLQDTKISAVLLTTLVDECRLKIGPQVVRLLVDKGFVNPGSGGNKWDNVILVGTKADKADNDSKQFFQDELVPLFFELGAPEQPSFAMVQKDYYEDLEQKIASVPNVAITYKEPDAKEIGEAIGEAFGCRPRDFEDELVRMRVHYRERVMAIGKDVATSAVRGSAIGAVVTVCAFGATLAMTSEGVIATAVMFSPIGSVVMAGGAVIGAGVGVLGGMSSLSQSCAATEPPAEPKRG